MVSFDVQSLFTCLQVQDCIEIVRRRLVENDMPEEYAIILKHCLTTGYLLWNHKYYIQVDGVAMGSPVSPIVADIYMEDFEVRALKTAPISPRFYKRYVDDTFTILPTDSTCIFLEHLNSINNNIQFTMELEANNTLAFLDVLIIRNPDHSLSHSVYRKSTHTNRYLNGASHHHPRQLSAVGLSLFQRARGSVTRNTWTQSYSTSSRYCVTTTSEHRVSVTDPGERRQPQLSASLPYYHMSKESLTRLATS
ncbi:unnamed protein product [Euphydryas editha]|uniref:Reverse transcriptase domain-containing protein n=1 Tax=Euphydryas editha TaxID=104508 RepID=A0AAU9UI90_EUPED|nr:unnamed protein product [Euphydryas editha]